MKRHRSKVINWMSSPAKVIYPRASLLEAYTQMFEHDIHRLLVVDIDGSLLGIVTLSDIYQATPKLAGDDRSVEQKLQVAPQRVEAIMASDPVTVEPGDTIQEAAERMLEYEVSGLPVVEGNKVVGIITESDIFRLIVDSWAEESEGVRG